MDRCIQLSSGEVNMADDLGPSYEPCIDKVSVKEV